MSITVLVKINKLNNWSSKMKVIYKVEVDEDGNTFWYNQQGKFHREGGLPAVEYADGDKVWWVNGKQHREGGLPAVERANGSKIWWVNGHHVTEEQAKAMFNKPTCNGKVVEIDGRKFKLTEIT